MAEARPVLLWDADCGFCRRWVERVGYRVGERIEIASYQSSRDRFPELDEAALARAAHLVEPDGAVRVGADAILRANALAGGRQPLLWLYQRVAGVRWLIDRIYAWVAAHRPLVSRAAQRLVGPDFLPRQYRLTRWLALRLLGLVAVSAFVSLWLQVEGLAGEHGIVPAELVLDAVARAGGDSWAGDLVRAPTLAWIDASGSSLRLLCALGAAAGLLLLLDVAPGPMVLACYALYLSLVTVCGPFLPFQWDTLLLEVLVAALFLAPWRLRPRLQTDREPSWVGVWMMRLLVFKLMIMSGLVKLYGDPSWRELGALDDHFFTQPIPTWTAYYAHHAGDTLHAIGTAVTLVVELALPWLVFAPRLLRRWFFAGTAALMVAIAATGNYGFFNLLTLAIAVMLLDDAMLARLVPRRWRSRVPDPSQQPPRPRRYTAIVCAVLAVPILAIGATYARAGLDRSYRPGPVMGPLVEHTRGFYLARSYGLFAGMTHTRPEIVIEGSRDGRTWHAYRLPYKVQDLDEVPGFAGPHMPRLDWQMWFAALAPCERSPWMHRLFERLLEGSPPVRALFEHDPFGDVPPRFVRSFVYQYSFAGDDRLGHDGVEQGRWFRRQMVDLYCPMATLSRGRLRWVQPPP